MASLRVRSNPDSTDTIRIVSIGVIFAVSFIAAGFPVAARRLPFLSVPSSIFFAGKHFGTGVILSTAFIHLLSDAFANLSDKQIAGLKNIPGLVTLASLLTIFLIEYSSTVYVESIASRDRDADKLPPSPPTIEHNYSSPTPGGRRAASEPSAHDASGETAPLLSRQASRRDAYFDVYMHHHDHGHQGGHCMDSERRNKMIQLMGVLVLQLGIMLHSFVIGMTLAVTTASHLPSLLTALIFHQLFEGLSLGVRFAALPTSIPRGPAHSHHASSSSPESESTVTAPRNRSIRYVPMVLTFLFGITTPIGIAVGLVIKNTMHTKSDTPAALVTGGSTFRGVMSAISAGLLIYASCVELLAGDFVNDLDMRKSSRGRQIFALASLLGGALAMALIH